MSGNNYLQAAIIALTTVSVFAPAARADRISTLMNDQLRKRTFSAVEVLAGNKDGRVYFHRTAGKYSFDRNAPKISKNSIFDMASISKIFTAVATVKEIQKKKFKLNDSLEDVLGRRLVPFDKRDITIDMLLRHRSGLAPIFKLSGQQKNADKLIKHLLSAKLRANPNEKFIYSDTGFALLAQIVAKNNNRSFNEYLKRVIIPELGMKNTYLYAPPSGVTPRTVKAHNEDNYVVHDPRAKKMPNGAGHAGVFTTAKELSKLVLHLLEAKTGPLYGSYARLMTKKGSAGIRGLGLDVNSRYNKPLKGSCFSSGSFGHTGYTGTSFIADPATGDYLIILTNRTLSPLEFGKSVSGLNQFRTQMADMVCRY